MKSLQETFATATDINGNLALDMATRPVSPDPGTVDAVVYDETNDITKIYVPFTQFQDVKKEHDASYCTHCR
jgi:hypothetical protein